MVVKWWEKRNQKIKKEANGFPPLQTGKRIYLDSFSKLLRIFRKLLQREFCLSIYVFENRYTNRSFYRFIKYLGNNGERNNSNECGNVLFFSQLSSRKLTLIWQFDFVVNRGAILSHSHRWVFDHSFFLGDGERNHSIVTYNHLSATSLDEGTSSSE